MAEKRNTRPKRSAKPGGKKAQPSIQGHRKNIYRKSRYYRQRQRRIHICLGILAVLLVLIVSIFLHSCSSSAKPASSTGTQDAPVSNKQEIPDSNTEDTTSEAESTPTQAPVTLTISVVGDCTLGTDETFDYSTSLNAYYENYGKEYFLQNVKSIFQADDLTIANM